MAMLKHVGLLATVVVTLTSAIHAADPLPIGSLLTRPANFFDLEGKTLRFTPAGEAYELRLAPLEFQTELGTELGEPDFPVRGPYPPQGNAVQPVTRSWRVKLPFLFPFAGEAWSYVFVNSTGSFSFGRPETASNSERDAWADGTMRAVAAAIDVRTARNVELLIAPLWSVYGSRAGENHIYIRTSPEEIVVTWNTVRRKLPNVGYDPEGPNEFQAALKKTGQIVFSYRRVPERDGIVGVFPGGGGEFSRVDRLDDGADDAPSEVDVLSASIADAGTLLRFSLSMAQPVPERLEGGSLSYTFTLTSGGAECTIVLRVGEGSGRGGGSARSASSNCVGAPPRSAGYQVQGRRLDLFLSKTALDDPAKFSWRATVARSDRDGRNDPPPTVKDDVGSDKARPVALSVPAARGFDLSAAPRKQVGNFFEVFHYAALTKQMDRVMAHIYKRFGGDDDIASVFVDFRVDDLFNHGPSTGSVNVDVQGIGRASRARSGATFGSAKLQACHSPIFLGPRFSQTVKDDDREYRGYAFAVGWIAHELMHRWSAFLELRHPDVEHSTVLLDTSCACHWAQGLFAPSIARVSSMYSSSPYSETSPMGGAEWVENIDGTFSPTRKPYLAPMGMSGLDLYAMGLVPAEETKDTFVLVDLKRVSVDRYTARKIPVKVTDIIAASGLRIPASQGAQREFRYGVYLLHEDGRPPDPARLKQSKEIGEEMVKYFEAATGGRMKVRTGTSRTTVSR
jgi:hypothetical protein